MYENEKKLDYPWGDELPAFGQARVVADGLRWIRMPLPFALDHINLWLLRDEIDGRQGWTIVDCGVARDDVKALWEQRSEEHTYELQSLMRISYAVFCLKKKNRKESE